MIRVIRFGVNETDGCYFVQTDDGAIARFSNSGVDVSEFPGSFNFDYSIFRQYIEYERGRLRYVYKQDGIYGSIVIGTVPFSAPLKKWIHAVNACLPHPQHP